MFSQKYKNNVSHCLCLESLVKEGRKNTGRPEQVLVFGETFCEGRKSARRPEQVLVFGETYSMSKGKSQEEGSASLFGETCSDEGLIHYRCFTPSPSQP